MSSNREFPFFSIIMPTYNRANLILASIQTAIAQEYPHFEIIVVDDGSTDNTATVVKNLQKFHPNLYYYFHSLQLILLRIQGYTKYPQYMKLLSRY